MPGAGGRAWYWHLVVAELERRGHRSVAVELPGNDPSAGLDEYVDLIAAGALALSEPVVMVAQSLGGFSAPLACDHVPVRHLVLVNAMIPAPGETAGEWWDDVGWQAAAKASAERDGRPSPDVRDLDTLFFHDVPPDLVDVMRSDPDASVEAPQVFGEPWPLAAWPKVPTTVLSAREDRLFPPELQQRVARERLGLDVQELPGGHLVALSCAPVLADRLAEIGTQPNRTSAGATGGATP